MVYTVRQTKEPRIQNMQKTLSTFLLFITCSIGWLQAQKSKGIRALDKNLNTKKYTEYAPSLSADGKIMVFQSDNNRYRIWYLYEARLQTNGKWSKPRSIKSINHFGQKPSVGNGFQTDFIAAPCLSPDGNTLYFCATFAGNLGKRDLYVSYRGTNGEWGKPINVGAPVNTNASEDFPSISPEGDALYFARPNGKKRQQKTCYDLWVSLKNPQTGNWKKPEKLPKSINTGCEKCPRIQADGVTLVYSSVHEGGTTGFDLYKAVLNVKQTDWEQIGEISELNSPDFDQFVTVTGEGKGTKAYYNTQGKKTPDVFQVTPLPASLQLQQIRNNTGYLLATTDGKDTYVLGDQATLKLYLLEPGEKPYLLKAFKADTESGGFTLALRFGYDYKIKATAKGYESNEHTFRIGETSADYRMMLHKIGKATGALIAKNTGSNTGNKNKDQSLVVAQKNWKKAQNKLFFNPATGEVISQADLSKRWANKESNQTVKPRHKIHSESDLAKAYPEFKPYESNTFIKRNGGQTNILAKLKMPHLYFAYKSTILDAQSRVYLQTVYKLMQHHPDLHLRVEAHTDASGTWTSNLLLSEQRAKAVKAFLTDLGIPSGQIVVKGFGEARPLGASAAKNRRVALYFKAK
ncbi:outer membrane protein OmpA family, putative [Microscilla marina ATCC 23134]|uniref:Outer membrane protein OmpA family, putative n=2 Tax=Microscilla marina TaxID=1027 RepID=A1ZSH2_MICM2|nr:outer membrane protein OmpA family, putative [Microscilla marina ATCC 23134]